MYPDPVTNNTITPQLDAERGNYNLSMYNQLGLLVFGKNIPHSGGNVAQTMALPSLAPGIYIAELRDQAKKLNQQKLVVQ